jgi:hypothetical protein
MFHIVDTAWHDKLKFNVRFFFSQIPIVLVVSHHGAHVWTTSQHWRWIICRLWLDIENSWALLISKAFALYGIQRNIKIVCYLSKLGNLKITFKYSPGYCCGSSWKTQWEKRKLRWFYNYWPMGSSYSSTSRYSFSFYLILCYDSCFETWEIIFGPFSDFVCYFSYKNHQECLSFELLINICFFYMLVLENRVQILSCWYFCVCLLFNVYNTICGTSSTMYCHLHGLLIVR